MKLGMDDRHGRVMREVREGRNYGKIYMCVCVWWEDTDTKQCLCGGQGIFFRTQFSLFTMGFGDRILCSKSFSELSQLTVTFPPLWDFSTALQYSCLYLYNVLVLCDGLIACVLLLGLL